MKIVFFGTPRFAQIVLEKLIDSPYKPAFVVTAPDAKIGRGQKLQSSPVKQTAAKNNIRVVHPSRSLLEGLKGVDLAILAAYGKIIPSDILSTPKYGFINVHPSILPKYRGSSPIQSAILAGEEKTGISIMLLDEEIDHGPILAQEEIKIEKDDTHASIIEKLGKLGADLLIKVLPQYIFHLRGEKTLHLEGVLRSAKIFLPPKPQDHYRATFTKIIKKSDGFIDLENPPDPETLSRMIRAFYPWPGTWCRLMVNGKSLIVKFIPNNLTMKQFNNEPFLIQPEGKRPMTIKEFKNGYTEEFDQIKDLFEI